MTYEGIRLKINRVKRKLFHKIKNKKLKNKEFTIISNNCWAGMFYETYGLKKQSPTVGMFFMAPDYVEFVSHLKEYVKEPLTFIKPEESRWKDQVCGDSRFGSYPVGKIKDIEIFFLHYHDEETARAKWERRCSRINWDKLIVKFNDQNGCTAEDIKNFDAIPFDNKLIFTCKEWDCIPKDHYMLIKQFPKYDTIMASHEPTGKKIVQMINNL